MSSITDTLKHPWQDVDLIRTNPVFVADRLLSALKPWFIQDRFQESAEGRTRFSECLKLLADKGGRLPDAIVDRFRRLNFVSSDFRLESPAERPGVLGLTVDPKTDGAFVLPLRPERLESGAHWDVSRSLPFPEEDIQDLLIALLHAGVPDARGVPERLAYRFANPLKQKVRGNSMTVAATLAVLDELGGRIDRRFQAAVAFVEPGADGVFEEVTKVREKLGAALREHDRLSLAVVLEGGIAVEEIDRERVIDVWKVKNISDLAKRLGQAGHLAPLIVEGTAPLGRVELIRVQSHLRSLVEDRHMYTEAADLADRTRGCTAQPPTDPAVLTEIGRLSAGAYRHNGRFSDAVTLGQKIHQQVQLLGLGASDDEEADAAAEHAASLFSGHRFAEIPPLLRKWAEATALDQRRFRPLTRVSVWNTLARGLAILGHEGWDELFGRSLELHKQLGDSENIDRTTHYLIHARLRQGEAAGAREALMNAPGLGEVKGSGNPWVAFLHANLARLEARDWADPILEKRLNDGGRPPYAAWLYFQATARQAPRSPEDAISRLDQATKLLRQEADGVTGNVCNLFACFLELIAASRANDLARWAKALAEARAFLAGSPDHLAYYDKTLKSMPETPGLAAAEVLVNLVPYF